MVFYLVLLLVLFKELNSTLLSYLFSFLNRLSYSPQLNQMKNELKEMEAEQKNIFIMDEFSKHAKLQRKINSLKDRIEKFRGIENLHRAKWQNLLRLLLSTVTHFGLLFILYFYRSTTVMTIHPQFHSGYLLNRLMAFQTSSHEVGGVGCVFWLLCCQIGVRPVVSCIKNRFNSYSKSESKPIKE